MDFKKDIKYKIGRVIFIIATLAVAVSAVLMFFGVDLAMAPFFVGCFVMMIGNTIMVAVKYRYQQVAKDAPTFGDRVAWRWYDFKEFFKRKGFLGSVLYVLLIAAIVTTAVFGVRAASAAYDYAGTWNGGYKYNLKLYEEQLAEAAAARAESEKFLEEGNIVDANLKERESKRYDTMAEKYLEDSTNNYNTALKLKPIKEKRLGAFFDVLTVSAVVVMAFIAEIILRKILKRNKV